MQPAACLDFSGRKSDWEGMPRRPVVGLRSITMLRTRLYVECPNCRMQYMMKDFSLIYSNGAYIENVAGSPEWQRLICPCQPQDPHKFKLKEKMRLHVFSEHESEQTHFSLKATKPFFYSLASSKP